MIKTFAEYEAKVKETAGYPFSTEQYKEDTDFFINEMTYPTLGLVGEAGEFADKVKQVLRDCDGILDNEKRQALILELSDVMWYCSRLAFHLGTDMASVAQANIDKLASRKARGVLGGSGDDR